MSRPRQLFTGWIQRLRIRRWQEQQSRIDAQQRNAAERSEMRAKGVLKEGMPPSPM
jgi:hypothetical protein